MKPRARTPSASRRLRTTSRTRGGIGELAAGHESPQSGLLRGLLPGAIPHRDMDQAQLRSHALAVGGLAGARRAGEDEPQGAGFGADRGSGLPGRASRGMGGFDLRGSDARGHDRGRKGDRGKRGLQMGEAQGGERGQGERGRNRGHREARGPGARDALRNGVLGPGREKRLEQEGKRQRECGKQPSVVSPTLLYIRMGRHCGGSRNPNPVIPLAEDLTSIGLCLGNAFASALRPTNP